MTQTKQVQKAQSIVNKAVGVFNSAVADIQKAQNLLRDEVAKDDERIISLNAEIDSIRADKAEKTKLIEENGSLLKELSKFSK